MRVSTFTIADEGTASDAQAGKGSRLVALKVPTMDSTTITFEASMDGGSTFAAIYSAAHGSAPAAITLGTANTGGFFQPVPEEVQRISAVAMIRLVTAAQNGGPRTIGAIWEKLAEAA